MFTLGKRISHFICILISACFFSLSVMSLSCFALTYTYRGSVKIIAGQSVVTSSAYAGTAGYGKLYNTSGSGEYANLNFQYSSGNGYSTLFTISAAPGKTVSTNAWGNATTDKLFRVKVLSSSGLGYTVAYGYVYTSNGN